MINSAIHEKLKLFKYDINIMKKMVDNTPGFFVGLNFNATVMRAILAKSCAGGWLFVC